MAGIITEKGKLSMDVEQRGAGMKEWGMSESRKKTVLKSGFKRMMMNLLLSWMGVTILLFGCLTSQTAWTQIPPLSADQPILGWTLLSDSTDDNLRAIKRAAAYNINHLQLSHRIIHDLRYVRDIHKRRMIRTLTDAAHQAGIQEVVLWDHTLYPLDYYPARFRCGPDKTLDLDNPAFWEWFKDDYRQMLDEVPEIQGLVLTFIETGARIEQQFSAACKTDAEKFAAVVNAVADVVIGERKLNLYARTFAYDYREYQRIAEAINLFKSSEIRLMMKETPHDFFLLHPQDSYAGTFNRPTLIEYDAAGEFNGQGIILNTWPQYILERAKDYLRRDHIAGYVARVDRYGSTCIIDRPSEINLWALKCVHEDPAVTADQIYQQFISQRYSPQAVIHLQPAFESAFDIVTGVLYTLGLSTANHSRLDYDPYPSHWARHVSGKWLDPPVARIGHGINKEFHYWKDLVNTLAPVWAKAGGTQVQEIPWVLEKGWLDQKTDLMDEQYLRDVITQRNYAVSLARQSLEHIEQARNCLSEKDYNDLYHHLMHTLLTARLHCAVSAAYFGFRVYARGPEYRTPYVMSQTRQALRDIVQVAGEMDGYPVKPPVGQWDWSKDADTARRYYHWIAEQGWPESTQGHTNPYAAVKFPISSDAVAGQVDLRPIFSRWQLGPRNQGGRDTCSVFTVAVALEYALAAKQGSGVRLSVEYLNWASNQVLGHYNDGGFFSDIWKGFLAHGICPEQDVPYQDSFNPSLNPPEEIKTNASRFLENGFRMHWIKPWNRNTGLTDKELAEIKQVLSRKWPVCGGFRWPLKVHWNNDVLNTPPPEGVSDGHSVLLVGYRDDPNMPGGGVFVFRNTNNGGREGWMTYEYAGVYMNDAMWIDYQMDEKSMLAGSQ